MKKIIVLALAAACVFALNGCRTDPSEATEKNFKAALDRVLNKTNVKIMGPGIIIDAQNNIFALEDPHAKENEGKQYKVKDVGVYDALIDYAKAFEKAGGVELKEQEFIAPAAFGEGEKTYGYIIDYKEDLKKDVQVIPMMGLPVVDAGVLCVEKIVSFTPPKEHNGITVSEVTFKKGICNYPKGISKEVIIKSGVLKDISDNSTYKLKQTEHGWEVMVAESFSFDYLKNFIEQNIK